MVRKTNPGHPKLNIFLALFLCLISVLTVFAILTILKTFREKQLADYTATLEAISADLETYEKKYAFAYNEIVMTRRTISQDSLQQLRDYYNSLFSRIQNATTTNSDTSNNLSSIISQRITHIAILEDLNQTSRIEFMLANEIDNYTACTQKIAYNSLATKVVPQLSSCTEFIKNAVQIAYELPETTLSRCSLTSSPSFILEKTQKTHEKLLEFYTLSANHQTREAALADSEYKKLNSELIQLPKWNTCITAYLQSNIDTLVTD